MAEPDASGLFEESPVDLRRLVLLLYGLVLPPFLGVLALSSLPSRRVPSLLLVLFPCVVAAGWVWWRRTPTPRDWVFPVGIVPTVCCGVGYIATGGTGLGFAAVMAAPLAWSAVLCGGPTVVAAWVTGVVTCLCMQAAAGGWLAAAGSAALFGVIQGLVAWVVFGKTEHHREARLRSLERQLNDIELLLNSDGVIVDANDRAVEAYGHPREELVGASLDLVLRARDRPLRAERLLEIDRLGGQVFETEHQRRDGTGFPVEVSSRIYGFKGRKFIHSVVRDISARRAAEAQRRFVENLFAHLTEAVVVLDEVFRVKVWSKGAERIFGWTSDEALGRSPFEFLIPPEGEAATARAITAAAAGDESTYLMSRCRKDGSRITCSVNIVAVQDGAGAITGVMGVGRDVTAQHAAEEALRESEERLTMALAASDTEIWEWEKGRAAVHIGPRWAALLGTPGQELSAAVLDRVEEHVHPEDRAVLAAAVKDHLAGRVESLAKEVRISLADGSVRWASLRGRVVSRDEGGAPARLVGTVRDVTQRKLAEEERSRLLAEARRATQAREQILAVVAHDLRNPLAVVLATARGLSEVAGQPDAEAELFERGDLIESATRRMSRLVEDLLDDAAIQKGSLRLEPECLAGAALLQDAVRGAFPQAARAGVSVELAVDSPPPEVYCDRGRILQVLGNLLSNSVHATPRGGRVTLRFAVVEEGLRFTVEDTGRGLEEGQAARLFQPYQRGATSSYKGAGLGLAIARGIVEGHGGRIWAESPAQGGAAFHFVLPSAGP